MHLQSTETVLTLGVLMIEPLLVDTVGMPTSITVMLVLLVLGICILFVGGFVWFLAGGDSAGDDRRYDPEG